MPERPGVLLGGVDLDACRDPDSGDVAPWAAEVVARLGTYAEVSPSGTGVKVYFAFPAGDLAALRAAMGTEYGRSFKRAGGEHPPAIELHTGHRYFAWTGQHLHGTPEDIRVVQLEALLWLVHVAGPGFAAGAKDGDSDALEPMHDDDAALMARLRSALDGDPALARRWHGDTAGLKDASRSTVAFAVCAGLRRHGFGMEDARTLLHRNPRTREWMATKGEANGGRELRRMWDATAPHSAAATEPPPEPDLRVLDLHRRPPPAFPLAVLGAEWWRWVEDTAGAAATSPDYVLAPLLAAASATIGNARWAQAHPGWEEPPHLWMCSVGDSGGGKSPGADAILKHVLPSVEEAMGRDFPEKRREWEAAVAAAKARREEWQTAVKKAKDGGAPPQPPPADSEEPPEPQPPCLRMNDTTIERVALMLANGSPKGLLMARDELVGHLK